MFKENDLFLVRKASILIGTLATLLGIFSVIVGFFSGALICIFLSLAFYIIYLLMGNKIEIIKTRKLLERR